MGAAVRYSFETGFNDYIQERERQRLTDLADVLANEYREQGGWDAQSKKYWNRLLRFSLHNQVERKVHSVLRFSLVSTQGELIAGYKINNDSRQRKIPITVAGDVVGWIYSVTHLPKALNDGVDRQFQERQFQATWVIVVLSVLLAILVSLFLARVLVVPVKRLARATNSLANGDYTVRVQRDAHDELGELARNFNQLAFSLERNKSLRHDLMADISHELRTPLSVLRSEIEAMQDGIKAVDQAGLDSLLFEIRHLSKLIDDLYELSLADAGALTYNKADLDLSVLIGQQISLNADRFSRAGIVVEHDLQPDLFINADASRLTQLINNLLENSRRYTDAPGQIKISLQRSGNMAHICIEDSAPGVGPDQADSLFERFYRGEASRNKAYGGAGLGLAICSQIVQAHQGKINAQPAAMGGLQVDILLPLIRQGEYS